MEIPSCFDSKFCSHSHTFRGGIPQIIDFLDRTNRQLQRLTSGIVVLCRIMRAQRILEGNFSSQLQGLLCSGTR